MEHHDLKRDPNLDAEQWPRDDFSGDLGHAPTFHDRVDPETRPPHHHEPLPPRVAGWPREDVDRLPILREGTRLEQGSEYVDLDDPSLRPFTALADQTASHDHRYVSKHDTGYVLWNRLVGDDDRPNVVRPDEER